VTLSVIAAQAKASAAAGALLWLFGGAAVFLVVGFALAAFLSLRHTRTRRDRARLLQTYLTGAERRADLRQRVMHISIGDLVRDANVAEAVTRGLGGEPARDVET
jgi:hypothetical protein